MLLPEQGSTFLSSRSTLVSLSLILSLTHSYVNIVYNYACTDPKETDCFGGWFGSFLTKYFLGYDMMIISSFKNLLPEKVGMSSYYINKISSLVKNLYQMYSTNLLTVTANIVCIKVVSFCPSLDYRFRVRQGLPYW